MRGAVANKISLENYLMNTNYPEIVTMNETKLGSLTRYELQGYECVSRKETAQVGGSRGSMILIRKDIKDVVELDGAKNCFPNDEFIGIEICGTQDHPSIKVFTYYNPPDTYANTNIIDYVNRQNGICVLTGDLNCKNLSWGSSTTDKYGEGLQESINRSQLYVCNDGSTTRNDPHSGKEEVLDLIIHNFDAIPLFRKFWTGECIGSDHFPCHGWYQFKPKPDPTVVKERRIENTNWTSFESSLTSFASEFIVSQSLNKEEIDTAVETISDKIMSSFNDACPLREKKTKKRFKFTEEIRVKVKEKRKAWREKSAAMARDDWPMVRQKMTEINRLGIDIKRLQKQQQKRDLEKHCEILNNEKNSKKFFQTFQKLADPIIKDAPLPLNTATITDEQGEKAGTSQDKANLFAKRLQKVHQEPDFEGFNEEFKTTVETYLADNEKTYKVKPGTVYAEPEQGDSSALLTPVTTDEIKETLKQCKNRSAVGTDQISYQLLKKLPDAFLITIAAIFTCCFQTGYFPDKWKTAKTIMIPKPGKDQKSVKNHRPISLLSCLSKLFERIIAKRLSTFMEEKQLFAKTQSGFRAGRMTSEHILNLTESSFMAFKKQQAVASIFLDAEMAFDKCWLNGIRYKLKNHLNLPDSYIRLLSSFLTNRSLKVFMNGCWSPTVFLHAGTPQGSPLSPLLYLIMVNDIPQTISTIGKIFQYADDIAMAVVAYTFDAARHRLQQMLNILESWCRKWRIKLNGDKSNFLLIHRIQSDNDDMSLQLFNDIVRPKPHAKFLGVEVDRRLNFSKHISEICSKANKRLAVIRFLSRAGTKPEVLIKLYKIYIRSLFESGSISFITAPQIHLDKLQKIQNEAIRRCLRLPAYISIRLLHESSGLPLVKDRLKVFNLGLVTKMSQRNPSIRELRDEVNVLNDTYVGSLKSPLDIILE